MDGEKVSFGHAASVHSVDTGRGSSTDDTSGGGRSRSIWQCAGCNHSIISPRPLLATDVPLGRTWHARSGKEGNRDKNRIASLLHAHCYNWQLTSGVSVTLLGRPLDPALGSATVHGCVHVCI